MARRRPGRRRIWRLALAVFVATLVAGLAAGTASMTDAAPARGARQVAQRLADTGLYSDFASRTVDPRNLHYSPQYPLWSDGAGKSRWIYLPPGTAIDARDPEVWVFPVGTKFWKEFAWSRRVETRYLERTRQGWIYAGVRLDRGHAIPSVADCMNCHRGGRAEILGFGALQLSPDRDPLAPNAEPSSDGDVTLATLLERGLVRGLPRDLVERPPRIAASTPRGRAAMGYLHANCSICHDSVGPMSSLGVSLRHSLRARQQGDEPAAAAIGRPSGFQLPASPPARASGSTPARRRPAPSWPGWRRGTPSSRCRPSARSSSTRRRWRSSEDGSRRIYAHPSRTGSDPRSQEDSRKTFVWAVFAALAVVVVAGAALGAPKQSADSALVKRGKYLVTVGGCNDCHTPWKMGPNGPEQDMSRMLSGHPDVLAMPAAPEVTPPWGGAVAATFTAWAGPWGVSFTANLTPDPETGLGKWTVRNFIETMRSGRHLGRGRPILPPMPWFDYAKMTDDDLKATFAYLQSIPPIKNRVPQPIVREAAGAPPAAAGGPPRGETEGSTTGTGSAQPGR